jgi:hypothetical protein
VAHVNQTLPDRGTSFAAWAQTSPPSTADLTLAETIIRISRHETVEGLIEVGSSSGPGLTPASDYDLILVLSCMRVPLHVALTYIAGRVTDVIFYPAAAIARILEAESLQDAADAMEGKLIRWLQSGLVVFDRSGRLGRAQEKVRNGQWLRMATDSELYATWFHINYNVTQTRRMLVSTDPVYQTAIDIRLLYTLADLWTAYFRVRRLPWEGEKGAVRYLEVHDAHFLALFRRCLAETDRVHRAALYEQLAVLVLAPIGGLWGEPVTAIQLDMGSDAALTPEVLQDALAFWQELTAPPEPLHEKG